MEAMWIPSSQGGGPLPPLAVQGGHDIDGSVLYVGRAFHEGDFIPAKVLPFKSVAFVSWGGTEHMKHHYEMLTGNNYQWITSVAGQVPPHAVSGGKTNSGEILYVGRGHHAGSLCIGKVHPSHGCLYIPFGGQEVRLDNYEVLVQQSMVGHTWMPTSPHHVPPEAVIAGHDSDGAIIYVGRAMHDGEWLPAKFLPSKGCAYVAYKGFEHMKSQCEVLCGHGYSWYTSPHHGVMSPHAVSSGHARTGLPMYIGRGHYQGSLTPGVIAANTTCLYIPYGGQEICVNQFEILVKY